MSTGIKGFASLTQKGSGQEGGRGYNCDEAEPEERCEREGFIV